MITSKALLVAFSRPRAVRGTGVLPEKTEKFHPTPVYRLASPSSIPSVVHHWKNPIRFRPFPFFSLFSFLFFFLHQKANRASHDHCFSPLGDFLWQCVAMLLPLKEVGAPALEIDK